VEWSKTSLYIPQIPEDCKSILAYSLVSDGLPRLTLSWEVGDDKTYSMIRVFNFSKEVPFETLCNVHSPRSLPSLTHPPSPPPPHDSTVGEMGNKAKAGPEELPRILSLYVPLPSAEGTPLFILSPYPTTPQGIELRETNWSQHNFWESSEAPES
jgi:hypothetical protein